MSPYDNNGLRSMSLIKKAALSVFVFLILALLLEVLSRCVYFQRNAIVPSALLYYAAKAGAKVVDSKVELVRTSSLYRDDPVMGFRLRPGRHDFSLKYTALHGLIKKYWAYSVDISPEGYRCDTNRLCSPGSPEIWLFGCSYAMGWPLQYEDSFAFHAQSALTNYCIVNYAVNGYGNYHWLLQLEELLVAHRAPKYCIFAYHPMHLDRNVASQNFINILSVSQNGYHYPRAYLDASGNLKGSLIEVANREEPEPSDAYKQEAAKAIFKEIRDLCDKHKIRPVLAYLSGDDNNVVVQYCRQIGYDVIDMCVYITPDNQKQPFDAHPNEKAHKMFAEKLVSGVKRLDNQKP